MLAALPIIGWITFFNHKNPEKAQYILLVFVAGVLSVVPIKLYEKYWDTSLLWFENIDMFRSLADLVAVPSLNTFLAYVILHFLVSMGMYLFSIVMMFVLEVVIMRDDTVSVYIHKTARVLESPFFFGTMGVLVGAVAFFVNRSLSEVAWFFVVVGMLEEYLKHLVLRFSGEDKITSIDDALSFAIIVALGFAFIENVLYFLDYLQFNPMLTQKFWVFFFLRSTISVLAHVGFSGILGYYYGFAEFSHEMVRHESVQKKHWMLGVMHCALHMKTCTLYHEEKMMEGMIIAMTLHAIFNVLLEFNKLQFVVPMVLLMFVTVLNLYHRKNAYIADGTLNDFNEDTRLIKV